MAENEQTDLILGSSTIIEEAAALDAEQDSIVKRILELEKEGDNTVAYPIERVRGHVGRWLIPREGSLTAHYKLVKEKERDIDFSPANYPGFDAIFTEQYEKLANRPEGTGFFDPLNSYFPRYEPLRDNLATVRNYMLQLYFPDNSPDDQLRIAHLKEIADYLAEGLANDRSFFGLVPYHNPFKPFIDINKASAKDGEGARYLYQKILEMQRHNNWTRPFSALTALLGGHHYGAWDLPSLQDSAFARDLGADDEEAQRSIGAEIAGLSASYEAVEHKRAALADRQRASDAATDLDALGSQLLFSYYQMRDAVEDLSAPIRREAIDIAHEILRKLSMKLGSTSVANGLSFRPTDDNAALGSSSGVGRMLVKMTGMMRALGEDMLAHPAVAGAHQALGQLAYLAKLEALNMATQAGNTKLAGNIRRQLSQMAAFGHDLDGKSFGDLLDKMKGGINALQQKLRAAGLAVDEHHEDHSLAGHGSGSQMQAVANVRQQIAKQQRMFEAKHQHGHNSAQQGQAAQTSAMVQSAMAQAQAAHKAHAPAGQQPAYAAPAVSVKKAPNGAVALRNAKRAMKTAQFEIAKQAAAVASAPPPPPPPPPAKPAAPGLTHFDPRLLAGLGTQLRQAESTANSLTSGTIGPKSAADKVRQVRIEQANKQVAQEESMTQYELQHQQQHQHQPKPPGGRSR